jgi:protein associated with RNAse G/E
MKTLANKKSQQITVRVLKYDGTEYRRWHASLAQQKDSLLVLDAEFECDVEHQLLGEIKRGTCTIEYYWLDRWYNIFQFLNEDGETRLFYCNVNMPPTFADGTLSYIDLDIDILVQPDCSYQVLDLDEFEKHSELFGYDDDTRRQARLAVDELIEMIEGRQFPFLQDPVRSSANSL